MGEKLFSVDITIETAQPVDGIGIGAIKAMRAALPGVQAVYATPLPFKGRHHVALALFGEHPIQGATVSMFRDRLPKATGQDLIAFVPHGLPSLAIHNPSDVAPGVE